MRIEGAHDLEGCSDSAAWGLTHRITFFRDLEGRTVGNSTQVARLVLPALLDDSLPLREATARLLTKLMSRDLLVDAKDKAKLHEAWRAAVGVAE